MTFYINITEMGQFDFFTKNSKVCVVDFHANWCGPCKKLSQLLQSNIESNDKYKEFLLLKDCEITIDDIKDKMVFIKIDVTVMTDLSTAFEVSSIPLIHYYKDGELQNEVVKGLEVNNVISHINKYLF
jgi:thioredoxin 1